MGNVKNTIKKLISALGGKFSEELGIDLSKGKSTEIFKWFLASKLFGARIGTNVAIKAYREFKRCGVLSPEKILNPSSTSKSRINSNINYLRFSSFNFRHYIFES